MGRRSDHTRDELQALLLSEGHRLLAEGGLARFSGREVAKRAGYSVGTIYNVFGSLDHLLVALNSHTFTLWANALERELSRGPADRIAALVEAYFAFARDHTHLWSAIYEHRVAPDLLGPADHAARAALTTIVDAEVRAALPADTGTDIGRLTRSLIAVVHGHCSFALGGTFALLEEHDPAGSALARVRESLAMQGYDATLPVG
ncbi:TetR/AcrR family transcriptional regulator [Croceibacterium sp. TMG7-5b_MA50]|uniref:TetR/AcrR family transcriptional regulator n=1 Tax=Croceibacterium sp. TMG7-5b_MA50 TaxID=3121290 RepID=UPI003221677E